MHISDKNLPRRKLFIYQLKIHTRWKQISKKLVWYNLGNLVSYFFTYFICLNYFLGIKAGPAKLVLYQGFKKLEISSKQCNAGIYMKNSTTYTCACITGVWGFYQRYCEEPITIAGGDSYCFRMKDQSISQIVAFGNQKYPFEASLSIFKKNFFALTNSYTDDNNTRSDRSSSFLTITDTSWTIYGDNGDALCLKATTTGRRKFCLFRDGINPQQQQTKNGHRWKVIVKVKKGCLSTNVKRADVCADILPPNDSSDCSDDEDSVEQMSSNEIDLTDDLTSTTNLPWILTTTTSPENKNNRTISTTTESSNNEIPPGWIRIKPKKYTTKKPSNNEIPPGWIRIKPKKYTTKKPSNTILSTTTKSSSSSITTPTTTEDSNSLTTDNSISSTTDYLISSTTLSTTTKNSTKSSSSSSSEEWIPIYPIHRPTTTKIPVTALTTTTTEFPTDISTKVPKEDICKADLTREKVKQYWLMPENNACSKSINEAVFTDQLRRFTVKQFDKIYQSRLKSLTQMTQLLNYTKLIMQKTCQGSYVPEEFFQVAMNAFTMFLHEDFFYGVEGAIPDVYQRIIKTLRICLDKAQPHVFETDELDCGIKKINGWLILPGKRKKLQVSQRNSYKDFEPLIETTWKMFLNTHSLCFQNFQYSNDHHHFSVLVMELFSKSIYEKWIEPLDSQELYSFILPNFNFLKETMQNIDYCVAATNEISTCPAWLSRSGVPSKSTTIRKKRSIWVDKAAQDKRKSEVWNGEAFCLQKMEDPESYLGLDKCSLPIK